MSEQTSIYDLSPNFTHTDRGSFFTCGSCRGRKPEVLFGSWHGRGGGKWAECIHCLKKREKAQRLARKEKKTIMTWHDKFKANAQLIASWSKHPTTTVKDWSENCNQAALLLHEAGVEVVWIIP